MKSTDIKTVPINEGVRLELPVRQLDEFAKFGWFVVVFCGLAIVFMTFWSAIWLWAGISMMIEDGQLVGIGVATVSLLGLAGIFFAAKFATLGWYVAKEKTSCHVEVNSRYLISNERLGVFNWRRKFRIDSIKRLGIETDEQGARKKLMTISAASDAKSFLVAPGYSLPVLEQVITEVGTQINRVRSPTDQVQVSMEVQVHAEESDESGIPGTPSKKQLEKEFLQPPNSKITVYDYGGTDAFQVPPMGIWKGSKGLLGFSLFWNGFMVVFTSIAIFAGAEEIPKQINAMGWLGILFAVAFLGVFWAVGVGSLIAAINSGKRSAMIGIADGQLFIERKSIFGTKWVEIPVDQVSSIEMGASGTEINNVPVMELKIDERNGTEHGLLSQLTNGDLRWIAQELRRSLDEVQTD